MHVNNKAMDALKCYKWPGNVRELKNMCERLQVLNNSNRITIKDLPQQILDTQESVVEMKYDPSLSLSDIKPILHFKCTQAFSHQRSERLMSLGITVKYSL